MLLPSVLVLLVALQTAHAQSWRPVAYSLNPAPVLTGSLSPNYALYNAERMHNGKIAGANSFAFLNGNVYTVTGDQKVVNIATCQPQVIANLARPGCANLAQCGYLTSIRVDPSGMLLVLDAYRGLFRVNPANGATEQLWQSSQPVNGRVSRYLNGMVVAPDGNIFISDSSETFDVANDIYIIMEGRPSGRVLLFNPITRVAAEVLKDVFVYPNGLEVTEDGTGLLIAESGRARILRMSLVPATFRQITTFADNLPGLPGNVRRSARGTYWVGLWFVRHAGFANSMDIFSNNIEARTRTVYSVRADQIRGFYPKYGLVVELDGTGRIVGSLHDPTGMVFSAMSEAAENEGLLYLASPTGRHVGRIVLPQGDGRVVTVDSVIQVGCLQVG
ncbi:adipocyte plasma membrane-associated protein [Elysia marginata]|uniref:Adipocyte plasma membrane-associated protein n=1 Tax=Elysia marginata TaxID=1093978 RepID=A0AAV4F1I5_9GAST|nr:adipocyte plasma membrane-associated protein [Elysia marginata]